MAVESLISQRFPDLPISVVVGERRLDVEAFIDTGFEGDLALPDALIEGLIPHDHQRYEVAGAGIEARRTSAFLSDAVSGCRRLGTEDNATLQPDRV